MIGQASGTNSRRYSAMVTLALAAAFSLVPLQSALAADGGTEALTGNTVQSESFANVFFLSYFTDANGQRHLELVGTAIIWLLLSLSVLNLGLIGRQALANQRKSIIPDGIVNEVRRLLSMGDYRHALDVTRRDGSFFSQLLHASLSEASHGFAAVIRSLENNAEMLVTSRMRPIELLYMFSQVSPMIGLLGTVYGIIHAFLAFVSTGGHANPALLAGGIGTALVATFWGLIVAIPALAGYAIIRNRVDELTLEATQAAEEILSQFKPRASAATPKPAALAGVGREAGEPSFTP